LIVVDGDRHRAGLGDLAVQDGKVRGAVFGVEAGVGTGGPGDCGHVAAQVFASHLDRGDLAIFQGLGLDLGDGWACATTAAGAHACIRYGLVHAYLMGGHCCDWVIDRNILPNGLPIAPGSPSPNQSHASAPGVCFTILTRQALASASTSSAVTISPALAASIPACTSRRIQAS